MSQAPTNMPTWSDLIDVNHHKAWEVLRRLEREDLLVLCARSLRYVPVSCLEQIFRDHADPHEIGDVERGQRPPLVEAVRAFVEAALRGDFYEDFMVNSRNFTLMSGGTQTFQAQLDLMFDRCGEEAAGGEAAQVVIAYELLLGLLREIDTFERDIVFFADEGGTWQFNIDWSRTLPPYFKCLAAVTEPVEFEQRAKAVIDEFVDLWQQDEVRQIAAKV